jgi:hypothetical protein
MSESSSSNLKLFNDEVKLLVKKLNDGTDTLRGRCEVCGGRFLGDEKEEFEELVSFLSPTPRVLY